MIEPGTEVTFVGTKKVGRSYKITAYEGKMIEFGKMFSRVAMKNGRKVMVQTNTVRQLGQMNALTEAVLEGLGA